MNRAASVTKREAWRKRLWRKTTSRTSVAEFCRQEGVSVQSFYYWKRRLSQMSAARPQPAFVPVRISEATPSSSLEIELPNQARVRVPADIARERLAEIIEAAGAAPIQSGAAWREGQGRC